MAAGAAQQRCCPGTSWRAVLGLRGFPNFPIGLLSSEKNLWLREEKMLSGNRKMPKLLAIGNGHESAANPVCGEIPPQAASLPRVPQHQLSCHGNGLVLPPRVGAATRRWVRVLPGSLHSLCLSTVYLLPCCMREAVASTVVLTNCEAPRAEADHGLVLGASSQPLTRPEGRQGQGQGQGQDRDRERDGDGDGDGDGDNDKPTRGTLLSLCLAG